MRRGGRPSSCEGALYHLSPIEWPGWAYEDGVCPHVMLGARPLPSRDGSLSPLLRTRRLPDPGAHSGSQDVREEALLRPCCGAAAPA
ncbi:hypothetical protein NDU88_003035 [Pleurodeles waltl]|uniref:Uncharacterized protein n=1 Tax=Pleurodeles waltl TaxID=8319 RepID=A0AAV7TME5_PLEWA|nr:hypothetical protein NDU88_003035 [Pleurodeles waltl]